MSFSSTILILSIGIKVSALVAFFSSAVDPASYFKTVGTMFDTTSSVPTQTVAGLQFTREVPSSAQDLASVFSQAESEC